MTAKTATLVKNLDNFRGWAALYRMEPPHDGHPYCIVSAAHVPFSGPETYIFPATSAGEVADWGELDGSYKGGLDHAEALEGAGYTIG